MAWESRMRESGEDHRSLQGEGVKEFTMFRNDLEALSGVELEIDADLRRPFFRHLIERFYRDESGEAFLPDEPEPEDFVLGELVYRFKSNDVKFFKALLRYVEKRSEPEPKKPLAGHVAPIAFKLGTQLGQNPTYAQVLDAVREEEFAFSESNASAMLNNLGLEFLEHRKPGPKRSS